MRKRKRTPYTESLDQPINTYDGEQLTGYPTPASPEEVFDRTHLDGRLQEALESLSPEFRMAVILVTSRVSPMRDRADNEHVHRDSHGAEYTEDDGSEREARSLPFRAWAR